MIQSAATTTQESSSEHAVVSSQMKTLDGVDLQWKWSVLSGLWVQPAGMAEGWDGKLGGGEMAGLKA